MKIERRREEIWTKIKRRRKEINFGQIVKGEGRRFGQVASQRRKK